MLRADVGTDLYGQAVGIGKGHTGEYGGGKATSETVACANGVDHIHVGRRLEALLCRGKDVAAIGATSEDEHLQVVLAKDEPAFVLHVKARIVEETADGDELLVVDLQDVALTERESWMISLV